MAANRPIGCRRIAGSSIVLTLLRGNSGSNHNTQVLEICSNHSDSDHIGTRCVLESEPSLTFSAQLVGREMLGYGNLYARSWFLRTCGPFQQDGRARISLVSRHIAPISSAAGRPAEDRTRLHSLKKTSHAAQFSEWVRF